MNPTVQPERAATRVAHYVIVRPIGVGGMGQVFLARDERLRRHVAIKVLLGPDADPPGPRRLLAEARLLSRAFHPYVAALYDFVSQAGRDYIVMEYVPGATLKEVLAGGPLPSDDVVRLGLQLARGLAAAHAAQVLHRDLKPQNVKLTPSGRVKILDFGVAAALPVRRHRASDCGSSSVETRPEGTVAYMSPEQLRGLVLDERSDIFSLGTLLYEMATGQQAFPQRSLASLVEAIQFGDPLSLTSVNPLLPRELVVLIEKALEKEPGRRPQSAAGLAADLRGLQHGAKPKLFLRCSRRPVAVRTAAAVEVS